ETPSYLDGLPAHVAKPDAAPVAKPDTAPTAKPDVAPVAKPDTAPTAKPDAAPVAKPDTAPTAKPDVVPVAKLDTAPTAKPDVVPVAKPDVAPVAKPAFIDPIIEHLPESTDPLAGAAEANAPKPKPDTAPIGGGIFVTDFVNPFAADAEAVPAEAATAAAPAVAEEPKPAGDSIFDTGFANPFGEAAFTAPAGTATAHAQPAPPTIADSIFAPEAGDIFADAAAPLTQGATQAPFPATKPTQVQPIAPEPAPTPILDFESLPTAAPKPPAKPVAAAPKPAPVSEPPIKAAPITEAPSTPISSSPMSSRKHAQDIINKPVVFPFDEAPDKGKGAQDDIFKIPDSKTPEAHKPDIEGAAAKTGVAAKPQAPGKPGSQPDGKTDETDKKKPNKAVVIIVDILIIIAVIAVACWVVHRFAPGTGAAELIDKGLLKVTEFFGGSDPGAGADAAANANDPNFMMPISDGAALVSSQINKNYLIADVAYDPAAKWEDGRAYNIEGAAAAKPISDDFWKDSPLGKLRYDESAVAAVIQFDSDLIEYINNRTGKVLSRIVERSAAEKNLAEIVASVKQLSIERLGIGSIRKNGDDLYVWTKETITETKAGSPVQREVSRLYRLTPGDTEYRVSDFEDLA
ncbi:MAG: hypothetical protein LBG50_00760, partial [Clostridiales Family XIII bacterium]|nr:hypothetical protein [Clostridiales Family XIII bacterium]